ncbi:MAG: cyclic nucleotide-binding domain-containing protein [Anaerolineales bacterium]|jgi:CRP-like cAMP-binding protein
MELKEIMKGVELFDGLEKNEIDQVISLCQERQYNETEIVAKQNSPGDEFFIIQQGFVEVVVSGQAGGEGKVIVNLGTGQTVGEMSLVDQGPRSATIRAINTPTIVQVIKEKDFEALCLENTRIGYIVMRNIAADLSFRLRQRHLSDTIG